MSASPLLPVRLVVDVDAVPVQLVLSHTGRKIVVDHEVDADEAVILALGYKQEFKREFLLFSTFCVSFLVLGLLPSIATTLDYSTLVIGFTPLLWLLAMCGVGSVALLLAEISSAYPTSGGLYYATKQLAPPDKPVLAAYLSWFVGWSNWLVQITAAPSINYGCATMILSVKLYVVSDYLASNGEIFGLLVGIMIACSFILSMPTKWIARFNEVGSSANSIFLLIVFIMMLAGNDRKNISGTSSNFNTGGYAFAIVNQTDWPDGIAFIMSFLGCIWAMSGYDSPFHLAEETLNAQLFTPRAIVMTAGIGGIVGWAFQIALAFTAFDLDALTNSEIGQPFITYLAQILPHKMVLAASSLTIISSFFMGQANMVAASRVMYAYSRDGCFPLLRYWAMVNPWTKTPVNAVWINNLIGCLLLFLIFAGETAIGAIFSVGALGAFLSFTVPIFLKITVLRKTFVPGPWNLGVFSLPLGITLCAFVLMMVPILCFPYTRGKNLDPEGMNWTVLVYWGPQLIATLWFIIDAHKWFTGPKSNLDESYFAPVDADVLNGLEKQLSSGVVVVSSKEKENA